jgi:hypothetical protein
MVKRLHQLWMLIAVMIAVTGCHSGDRFTGDATALATKWHSDAVLVEVQATTFQLTPASGVMKSGAPQIITFHFYSPSTRKGFTVNAMAQGMQSSEDQLPASPYTLPIREKFVGVNDAIDQIHKSSGENIIVTNADLRVYWNAAGEPERTAWKITFVPAGGQEMTRYVDASSDETVAVEDRSIEPPNTGSTQGEVPAAMTFDALRRAAADNVATRGTGFALYNIALMIENTLSQGHYLATPDNKVQFSWADFEYASPTPTVNWHSMAIVFSRLSGPQTGISSTIDATIERTPPDVMPQTIPSNLLDPEPIIRQLQAAFPTRGLPGQGVYYWVENPTRFAVPLPPPDNGTGLATIWLTRQGAPRPLREDYPPDDRQYAFFTSTAPRDRWVWWTIVKHGRVLRGPIAYAPPVEYWEQYLYVDAVTGAKSTQCTQPVCYWSCNPPPPLPPVRCE